MTLGKSLHRCYDNHSPYSCESPRCRLPQLSLSQARWKELTCVSRLPCFIRCCDTQAVCSLCSLRLFRSAPPPVAAPYFLTVWSPHAPLSLTHHLAMCGRVTNSPELVSDLPFTSVVQAISGYSGYVTIWCTLFSQVWHNKCHCPLCINPFVRLG